jgi:Ankyrin repeats (3 copies)/Zinc finger, C3HC4 type (RING finger)
MLRGKWLLRHEYVWRVVDLMLTEGDHTAFELFVRHETKAHATSCFEHSFGGKPSMLVQLAEADVYTDVFRTLRDAGVNIGAPCSVGSSVLHAAAKLNAGHKVEFFVDECGVGVDLVGANGETPLIVAARLACANALLALLKSGGDAVARSIEARDARGYTALHHAVAHDPPGSYPVWAQQLRCIEALCAAGASIDARASDGATPLDLAARNRHPSAAGVVALLQSHRRVVSVAAAAVGSGDQCVVCRDACASHALVPCGHRCVCGKCARLTVCPICRAAVRSTLCVYDAGVAD